MDNLIALVTGANKGIGREIARQLAARGHTVYVGSRDAARGEEAVAQIGGDARLLVLDVTDAASVAAAARQVPELDVLVNNAGISGERQPVTDEDLDKFRRVYETNVFGVLAGAAPLGAPADRQHLKRHRLAGSVGRAGRGRDRVRPADRRLRRVPVVQDGAQ
jgi:NAD(P)-dependent dehydrogenase (short-subunit alcohol dehydrogenase family)